MTKDRPEPKYRDVPLGKTRINPFAQRELKQARVDALLAEFDLDMIGVPEVSDRDGWFYIVDGQHRIEATKLWLGQGWEDQRIRCRVWTGLTEEEEADVFLRLGNTLNLTTYDRFRIAVNAGRPVQTDIDRQVRLEGLKISRSGGPGHVGCVGTLERIYRRADVATLGRALRITRDAYGDAGMEGYVIDGIAHLCQRYNGQLDDELAVKKLSRANGGVSGLVGRAEIIRQKMGASKPMAIAAAAVEFINSGKGGKKLPSWWASA